jgi:hypothetical protein
MIGGGPEGGIFKTTNGGKNWMKLTRGLPTGDVGRVGLIATFGRGFYILDDYSALRDIAAQTLSEEARLFPLRDAYLFN